jgi:pantoate--beta-alanine ligase
MVICKTVSSLKEYLSFRGPGPLGGFIPTMGALHEGHASLIRQAKGNGRFVICSVFVNPTQFNDQGDYARYPHTLDQDIQLLEREGVDVLFLPSVAEMYPEGTASASHYDLGYLETILEGKYRPGHFQGVCQVVDRLLGIVGPDELYLGQKDYQQCLVIKRMIAERHLPVTVIICPTQREPSGLALSSRNLRLDPDQKTAAMALHQTLALIKAHLAAGPLGALKEAAKMSLSDQDFKVDYVEIAKSATLELLSNWDGHAPAIALVAAFTGEVRLIDNEILS